MTLHLPTTPVTLAAGEWILRAARDEDRDALIAAGDDPLIRRWSPRRSTPEDWLRNRADWSGGDHASWVIAPASAPEALAGAMSLHKISAEQEDAEVGYWLAPGFRGQGAARAGLLEVTRFGFEEIRLRRIMLFHAVENPASCRVATVCGYAPEGTHRSSYRYGDGRWYDEHSHGRLASDPPVAMS